VAERIRFSVEQDLIASSARGVLRDRAPIEAVRAWMETESGYDSALWKELAGLGWLGIAIPEEFGGAGMGTIEQVSLLEAMGRSMLGSPLLASGLAAELLMHAGTAAQKRRWLPALASGDEIGCVAIAESSGSWDPCELQARARAEHAPTGRASAGTGR
jgi:alkylation response protein AidB-like acyl-CoA dehydrogenase